MVTPSIAVVKIDYSAETYIKLENYLRDIALVSIISSNIVLAFFFTEILEIKTKDKYKESVLYFPSI